MKKIFMTLVMLVGITASAMMLSAFTTPKQDASPESSQLQMNDSPWKMVRERVAYCDGDTDQCVGYGNVWVNTDTSQAKIHLGGSTPEQGGGYDLTEYTGKQGYNYRFWSSSDKCYYYVYINLRY